MTESLIPSLPISEIFSKLNDLLGDLRAPSPFIQLVGMPGTGKTRLIKIYLKSLNSAWAYLDCSQYCYDRQSFEHDFLYKGILHQIRRGICLENEINTNNHSKQNKLATKSNIKIPGRIGSTFNFFTLLHRLLLQSCKESSPKSVVLVFDNINELIEVSPNLIGSLLRHKEYSDCYESETTHKRGLVMILISRYQIPPELFPGTLTPLTIKFETYTREQVKEIFFNSYERIAIASLMQLPLDKYKLIKNDLGEHELFIFSKSYFTTTPTYISESIKLSSQKLRDLWNHFINEFVNITYNEYKSDFKEMNFLCRQMWVVFLHPIAQKTLRGEIDTIATKLKKDLGLHIRKALSRPSSHFTSDLFDPSFLCPSLQKSLATTLVLEMSLFGKILITAAAIASSTHHSDDSKLLEQSLKFKVGSKRKSIRSKDTKKFQQNPFTLSRWLSITDTLTHIVFDKALDLNPFLNEQIVSLVHMRLILPWNNIEQKKRLKRGGSNEFSAANFSSLPFFDPFGQPFSSPVSKLSNPQKIMEFPKSINLHDPETRLFCQVPFDLIKQITKSLPGIKIEELI